MYTIIINYYTGVLRQVQGQLYISTIKRGKSMKFNFHVSSVQTYFRKSIVLNNLQVKIKLKIVVLFLRDISVSGILSTLYNNN